MRSRWRPPLIAFLLGVSVGACSLDFPFDLGNHRPHISSVTVFPNVITRADSVTVTVVARDADEDILVYDWITDGRLRIRGAIPSDHSLYNTSTNSMVFYPEYTPSLPDTPWVNCSARDGRGASDSRTVRFIVRQ
jgi:hypothetical protein